MINIVNTDRYNMKWLNDDFILYTVRFIFLMWLLKLGTYLAKWSRYKVTSKLNFNCSFNDILLFVRVLFRSAPNSHNARDSIVFFLGQGCQWWLSGASITLNTLEAENFQFVLILQRRENWTTARIFDWSNRCRYVNEYYAVKVVLLRDKNSHTHTHTHYNRAPMSPTKIVCFY